MKKPLNINVEDGEIIIQNEAGDYAIIPKDKRKEFMNYINADCHNCIDKMVSKLPVMANYAQDGTVISDPGDKWLKRLADPLSHKKQVEKEANKLKDLDSGEYQRLARLQDNKDIEKKDMPTYEEQRRWMQDYISSPMYKQILQEEYTKSGNTGDVDSEIKRRRNNVSTVPIKEDRVDPRGYGYARGEYRTNTVNRNEVDLSTGKNLPARPKREILIDPDAKYIDSHVGLHELTHASTDNNRQLTKFAKEKMLDSTNPDRNPMWKDKESGREYGYFNDPTEVHARLTTLKFLMNRYGIYNPMQEKATKDHILKALDNPYIQRLIDIKDLNKMIEKKGNLVDLLNQIAYEQQQDNSEIS
jgi:hypothetical protein